MKCPVNFSRSLASLFFVSSWVPACAWWPLLASSAFLLASSRPRESLYGRRRRDTRFKSLSILFDWQHRACAPIFSRVVPARLRHPRMAPPLPSFQSPIHRTAFPSAVNGLKSLPAEFVEERSFLRVWADRWRGGYDRQSLLSVNSLPFCVTVDERSPSYPSTISCVWRCSPWPSAADSSSRRSSSLHRNLLSQ